MSYQDIVKFLTDDVAETYTRLINKFTHNRNQCARKCRSIINPAYPFDYHMFDIKSANNLIYAVMGNVTHEKNKKVGGAPYIITKFSYRGISHYAIILFNFVEDDNKPVWSIDIFHPHVMQRYFERVHNEYAEMNNENFLDFLSGIGGIKRLLTVPAAKYDHPKHGETLYKVVNDGIMVGNSINTGQICAYVYKTFLSEDLFKDSQAELHEALTFLSDLTAEVLDNRPVAEPYRKPKNLSLEDIFTDFNSQTEKESKDSYNPLISESVMKLIESDLDEDENEASAAS